MQRRIQSSYILGCIPFMLIPLSWLIWTQKSRQMVSRSSDHKFHREVSNTSSSKYAMNEKLLFQQKWNLFVKSMRQLTQECYILDKLYTKLNISRHKSICQRFSLEAKRPRPVFTCPYSHLNDYPGSSVTLVVSLTLSRLDVFEDVMKHWQGPISVALYMDCQTDFEHVINRLHSWAAYIKDNLDIHIVLGTGEFYPFTYLRNVALKNSKTDYVLLNDVDFVPKYGLQKELRMMIVNNELTFDEKQVYIVPAFEFLGNYTVDMKYYPHTKTELLDLWERGIIDVFENAKGYKASHGPTNFSRWKEETNIYRVKYKLKFEPYIMARKRDIALYNDHLVGRYLDKISHILELYATGFQFYVLPNVYEIHMPHRRPPIPQISVYLRCAQRVMFDHMQRLSQIYTYPLFAKVYEIYLDRCKVLNAFEADEKNPGMTCLPPWKTP